MSGGEDLKISVRSMKRRPLETLLLVIGIALGIGATAAGIAMYAKSVNEGQKILSSTEYREIVIATREEAEDMEVPVLENSAEEDVILTVSDLDAAEIAGSVSYAYLANRVELRFGGFRNIGVPERGSADGGTRPEQSIAEQVETGSAGSAQTSEQSEVPSSAGSRQAPAGDTADPEQAENAGSEASFQGEFERIRELMASVQIDGPEPVVEEVGGYEVTAEFFPAWNMSAKEGSLITQDDVDSGAKILVLGSSLAETLFEDGVAMGRQVQVFTEILTITGILEPTGTSMDDMGFRPSSVADTQATGGFARRGVLNTTLHFTVDSAEDLEAAEQQLKSWFDSEYGEGSLSYSIPREEAEAAQDRSLKMSGITLVLALSGLLIASVNVANILYSRALRRRKQVGVLKALGATKNAIFSLFFKEGLIILAGGIILGSGVTYLLARIIGSAVGQGELSALVAGVGVLGACLVTLGFTILPSLQASRIAAAEAIRTE